MLEKLRGRLARWVAPPAKASATRMYHAARAGLSTTGWQTTNGSADTELYSSLTQLRSRSRALIRDSSYAKRAGTLVVNNVIGSGIAMNAQVATTRGGRLNARVNDDIEALWEEWACAETCHTGGELHFGDLERAGMAEVFAAGEVFFRLHLRAFGGGKVPFSLEMIEAERIADEFQFPSPPGAIAPGNTMRMGIERDAYHRPVAYWIRELHPNEYRSDTASRDRLVRVPADEIIHLRVITRWPQSRGEPWLHTAIRKLNDMDGYSEAEIVAARGAASYLATIETAEADLKALGKEDETGNTNFELSPGTTYRLNPGEKLNFVSPNRPNAAMDPFMRYMLREVAAGTNVSYESLSRDYSQSNYSSSRLGLLDDRDIWRTIQQYWIRAFRRRVHEKFIQQAVFARAIPSLALIDYANDIKRYTAANFKPRGWSWVDPTKEVEAYVTAVRAGFMTVSDVIALTGGGQDLEDVWKQRQRELEMMDEMGLTFDTGPEDQAPEPVKPVKPDKPDDPDQPDDETENQQDPPARVFSFGR